jgi:hypothetical protein
MVAVVWIHMSWMIAATLVGTWSGYLGLVRATQNAQGKSPLPGRFLMRQHEWTGIVFYAMLYLGILGGFLMVRYFLGNAAPEGLWAWHQYIAIAIAVLYAPGAILGLDMMLRKAAGRARPRPIAHMLFNFFACTLIAVQIVVALVGIWG